MDATTQPLGVVKCWLPKDSWYYLSNARRAEYMDEYNRIVADTNRRGARLLGSYKCRGQSRWARFEIWEFPELQVLIEFTNALEDIGHFEYFATDYTVGRRYAPRSKADSWKV